MSVAQNEPAPNVSQIDITERVIDPLPRPRAESVVYQAVYALGDVTFEVRNEYRADFLNYGPTLSVTGRVDAADGTFQHFALSGQNPPLGLFDPAFAAWLEQYGAECQRRYDARTAESRS